MARAWILALALFHPEDVDHIDAFIGADDSVNLSWTLPSDSSVVGLTIFRDNLDNGDTTIFQIMGLTTSFVDTGASSSHDYRYWIHTRDAEGDLSDGVFVEVFEDDGDHGHWTCSSTAGGGVSPWIGLLGAALLLAVLKRGR
ncbi:MAG TPA: hypothetical protein VF950_26765 [Planctomycetota bacterium]